TGLAHTGNELAEASARIEYLRRELRDHPRMLEAAAGTGEHDPMQLIAARLVELELQRSALRGTFAPTSERMEAINQQMADARRLLDREAERRAGLNGGTNRTYQFLELNLAQTEAQQASLAARRDALVLQREAGGARLEHLERIAGEDARLSRQLGAAK